MIVLDDNLRMKWFSSAAQTMFHLSVENLGRPVQSIPSRIPIAEIQNHIRKVMTGQTAEQVEIESPTGQKILVEIRPLISIQGKAEGALLVLVTDHKMKKRTARLEQANQRLRKRLRLHLELERQLMLILEAVPLGVVITDLSGKIGSGNTRAENIFGYGPGELTGKTIEELLPERLRANHEAERAEYLKVPQVRSMGVGLEVLGLCKDGREFPLEVALGPLRLNGTDGILCLIADITARKQLEKAARQTALLEEHNRLAREIHDTIAQSLSAIILQLTAAQEVLEKLPGEARRHITQARYTARSAYEDARGSLLLLHHGEGEPQNLLERVRAGVKEIVKGAEASVSVSCEGPQRALPPLVEYDLLRICLEALRNAVRHSGEKEFRIEFVFSADELRLIVADAGRGFDPKSPPGGFGLTSMRERAAKAGGKIDFRSSPGNGTQVEVVIPVPK